MERLKMIVAVADRGAGEGMARALRERGFGFSVLMQGSGTAKAAWMETLGLKDTGKDVLLLTAPESRVRPAFDALGEAAEGARHFFAFAVSLTSIAGNGVYRALTEGENAHGTGL